MVKMVQKRKRREDEDGKATIFKRSRNRTNFEEVGPAKLDRFQKRNRLEELEVVSQSSGMPSNIMYGTPSESRMIDSQYTDAGTALSRPQSPNTRTENLQRTNQQVKAIFERALLKPAYRSLLEPVSSWGGNGHRLAVQKRYHEAQIFYKSDSARVAEWKGKWFPLAVSLHHCGMLYEAASYPGCPQTLALRMTEVLSQRLMIERQAFLVLPREEQSTQELEDIINSLVSSTHGCIEIVTCHKALEIWEPVLGPKNSELGVIRERLKHYEQMRVICLEEIVWRTFTPAKPLHPIQYYLRAPHKGPADRLLELAPLIQLPSNRLTSEVRDEMLMLHRGRSHAFIGGYFSFLGQFEQAERSFQESERTLENEVCVEIRLHRMLWQAEHYTRVKNWKRVSILLYEAHGVFMAQEVASSFVLLHFPDRFRLLCTAAVTLISIDEVVYDVALYRRDELMDKRPLTVLPDTPGPPSPVLEVEELFPLGSTGHSTIDIDTWRQYVTFSPRPNSSSPSTAPRALLPPIPAH